MKTSNRILRAFTLYLLLLAVCSAIILVPYSSSQGEAQSRREAAGTVECAIFGGSHGLRAFDPSVLQEDLGWSSYNYCNVLIKDNAKEYLARKELARNPVKTVILDLTFNTLTRDNSAEGGEGDAGTVRCLDTFGEKLLYLVRYVGLDRSLHVYSRELIAAANYWASRILSRPVAVPLEGANRGFYPLAGHNIALPAKRVESSRDSLSYVGTVLEENLESFRRLVRHCQSQGARVIVVTTPITDSAIWQSNDMDVFSETANALTAELGCEYYDFNLLKTRGEVLSDSKSFDDDCHLSAAGSRAFMHELTALLKQVEGGQDVADLFYSDYQEAKNHSPYQS